MRKLQFEFEGINNTVDFELDDIRMKTKMVVGPGIKAVRFVEKSFFFSRALGFNRYWDYKHYNERLSQKLENLSTIDKNHLKHDVIDSSLLNGI